MAYIIALFSMTLSDRQGHCIQCKAFYRAALRNASAVCAVIVCRSVRLSVCLSLSQGSTVPKRLNIGSCKQRHTIAQGLYFTEPKISPKFQRDHPQTGR